VNEITERPIRNAIKQCVLARLVNPIPSNLRHDEITSEPPHKSL
jgi:hypothetical protein